MRIFKFALFAVLFAISTLAVRAGNGDDWTIVQATGQLWVQTGDVGKISLSPSSTLAPGATLSTGSNGRVLLRRGQETMIVGPNTIMSVPEGSDRFYTTIVQLTGAVEFDVEKRNVTHFAVKTPLLAAVVKGTHFTVQASDLRDAVSVTRGRVEVQNLSTGEAANVLPGQRAEVSVGGCLEVSSLGDRAQIDGLDLSGEDGGLAVEGGDGQGLSIGIGGSDGISIGLGGGSGISASVGGPGGIGVSAGGGNGIGIGIGGVSVGIGGH